VLGPTAFPCKLAPFVISSLIAVFAGMVCLLLIGTATPDSVAPTTVAISVLVVVVLGGIGTRWGPVAGAIIHVYLQQYLLTGRRAVVQRPAARPADAAVAAELPARRPLPAVHPVRARRYRRAGQPGMRSPALEMSRAISAAACGANRML
jgi:ABC-type branched-subunit amino acid transport system permease subunit